MLDQIMSAVSGNVLNELTEKAGINMDQAKAVLPVAQESLQSGLMEQVTGGNISGILGMFNSGGGLGDNPIFSSIKNQFAKGVMTKLGVPESVAGLVAGTGMTSMIGGLTNQLKGDSGEVTQDDLMSKLGLGGGGMMDMAKGMLGNMGGDAGNALDKLTDAAKDAGGLGDVAKGLGDKLGGFFGK